MGKAAVSSSELLGGEGRRTAGLACSPGDPVLIMARPRVR